MKAPLHHVDSGTEGHAVLLAHALGCDARMWDPVAALLARHHRVIQVDLRGHGASPVPKRPYTLAAMAEDVADLLARLGVPKVHWVGLSMGAMVGMAFALAHGDRLGRLVLANTTSWYGPEGRAQWEARIQAVAAGGLADIADTVSARYFSEEYRRRQPQAVARVMKRFLHTGVEGYLGCCEAIAGLDLRDALARIAAPTLVIAGDLDAGTPPAMAEAIARGIPEARLAILGGASHLSAVEKPREFAALVADFLA